MKNNIKTLYCPRSISDLSLALPIVKLIDELFDEVYLVGGAVRDDILQKETRDLDFAVPYASDFIISTLQVAGLPVRDNATKYGTVGTNVGEYDIQITTYRSEEYDQGSRNPIVHPIVDIDSDLYRRDFTVNAMAISRDEFIDPHDGLSDLEKKIVCCVGVPVV